MARNILLKSLYKVHNRVNLTGCVAKMIEYYDQYLEMQQISVQSFRSNLLGKWQLIELGGSFDDLASAFIHTFVQTHKIWREHAPCNILYVDPDVLCVRPVDIWEMMPDHAFLPELSNCGVRYFGWQTLPVQWNAGYEMLKSWDYDNYSYEQCLYQTMHLAYPMGRWEDMERRLVHQYPCYEDGPGSFANFNDFQEYMIHTHASRDPQLCLQQLKYLWDQVQSA